MTIIKYEKVTNGTLVPKEVLFVKSHPVISRIHN